VISGVARDVDAGDVGDLHVLRQGALQVGHGVADVVGDALVVDAQLELDEGRRKPSPTVELMWRTWPRPAIESSIRRVTWVSSSVGRGAGARGRDDHERQVDVGIVVDPHAAEAGDPGDGQQNEQQDDGDRVLDRPA
jgi:hypothetical protein